MAKKAASGKARAKTKTPKAAKTAKSPGGRSIKNAAGATEKPPVKNDVKQIGHDDFERVIKRRAGLRKQSKEISSSMGDLVASAVENKNLDKPAFDIVRKLWEMSPQKRLTTLACLDYYRKIPIEGKLLDADETGQTELSIPRPEAGAKPKGSEPAKDPTGASAKPPETKNGAATDAPKDGPKDLRPAHLRTPAEGGTKIDHVDDLKKAAEAQGASGSTH